MSNKTQCISIDSDGTLTVGGDGNGSVRVPDGSSASPSITFSADSDTGLHRLADDTIAISTGGQIRAVINQDGGVTLTGNLLVQNGSAADPTYAFAGEHNTGIYKRTDAMGSKVCVSTSGVDRLSVDSSGVKVGDGNGSGNPSIAFLNDPDTGIMRLADNALAIVTGGGLRVVVNSAGNVIITGGSLSAGCQHIGQDCSRYVSNEKRRRTGLHTNVGRQRQRYMDCTATIKAKKSSQTVSIRRPPSQKPGALPYTQLSYASYRRPREWFRSTYRRNYTPTLYQ